MFRLHKSKISKSKERFDFKFSQFKATQVPKGWDKLFVSIVSVEAGKTIAKSGKALVRNGSCQWAETLSESVWIPQDESSKEMEDRLVKLVLAMGSIRSGILGEATINMRSYMSSSASVPVSFPLKNCNHGTLLQVKIQCLTPRTDIRDEKSKGLVSQKEDPNADSRDANIKSDGSGSLPGRSTGSSSGQNVVSTSSPGEPGRRETIFYEPGSNDSHGSANSLEGREHLSPRNNSNDDEVKLARRQDSTSSVNSVTQGSYHGDDHSQSSHSSFNSRITYSGNDSQDNQQELMTLPLRTGGSSKSLLEAAEDTIRKLHEEAKMWERDARKLMVELDILRKELSEQSKNQANLDMELSVANAERDGLRKEVEQLKLLVEKPMSNQEVFEDSKDNKELENEIKFQKESNAALALQLKKSQEANIEFVSALQELEETIEKQRTEIETISDLKSKVNDMENSIQEHVQENQNLMLQLQQSKQSEKSLQAQLQLLEQTLEEKDNEINDAESLNKQKLFDIETDYKSKLSAKEEEIFNLKAQLSTFVKDDNERFSAKMELKTTGDASLAREIKCLKTQLEELERDCDELTEENLELLFKLKETTKNSMMKGESAELSSTGILAEYCGSEVSEQKSKRLYTEEKLKKEVLKEIQDDHDLSIRELESLKRKLEVKVAELDDELTCKKAEIERLEGDLLSREEEIVELRQSQSEFEAKISNHIKEKLLLEESVLIKRESDKTTKRLNDFQSDSALFNSSLDSRALERKYLELETERGELELQLSWREHENEELSTCISDLKTQLRDLTDERNSKQMELENSRSLTRDLQAEITRLRTEMETQTADLSQQLQYIDKQFSETQEESEYLRIENQKLQDTAESLMLECNSLQKSNGGLRKEKLELHEYCGSLEAKLRETNKSLADCSKRVQILEESLSSVLEDFALKEKSLSYGLDVLLDENRKHMEKIRTGESLLNEVSSQKATEVENLQSKVAKLTEQLSAIHEERERIASDALMEVSVLHAEKAKQESALQQIQHEAKRTADELATIRKEAETKGQSLMHELAALKENSEKLESDYKRVLKLLENYKSMEENFKNSVNDLELKLTVSEYERQQLMEETSNLKVQLLKIDHLQDEVLTFKNELNAVNTDKEQVETALHLISRECELLKTENSSLLEKISTLQKVASELDYKTKKVQKMDRDHMAKKAPFAQDNELKNELGHIKRTNRQLQRKMQVLEEEKEESLRRRQALEEFSRQEKQKQQESNETSSYKNEHEREVDNKHEIHNAIDAFAKIQFLENELTKVLEANNTYKVQLDRLLSDRRNNQANVPAKSTAEGEVSKERYERAKSLLEAELRDIRERYFHMSLKYAEVETQREELIMKLKGAKNGRRWFS